MLATTELKKSQELADRYLFVHDMTAHLGNPNDVGMAIDKLNNCLNRNQPKELIKITTGEIKKYIKNLKIRKAPGHDGITNFTINCCR